MCTGVLPFAVLLCCALRRCPRLKGRPQDICKPDSARLRRNLSAVINFAKFREEKLGPFTEMQEAAEAQLEESAALEQQKRRLVCAQPCCPCPARMRVPLPHCKPQVSALVRKVSGGGWGTEALGRAVQAAELRQLQDEQAAQEPVRARSLPVLCPYQSGVLTNRIIDWIGRSSRTHATV